MVDIPTEWQCYEVKRNLFLLYILGKKEKAIKVLHWNSNSITGKFQKIENLIREENPDVISLNETRTNTTTESYVFELSRLGYFPIIRSRKVIKENKWLKYPWHTHKFYF